MNLEEFGLKGPITRLAKSVDEAICAADDIGYPVVLKISSPDILHKTDVGGVKVGLMNSGEVESAFHLILKNISNRCPGATVDGIMIQEMVQQGIEVIIGLLRDPQFGMTIMFGLGGIFAEILRDVSFRVLPITEHDARSMIHEIKGHSILNGYRNLEPVSEDLIVDLLLQISKKGHSLRNELEAVDLNPVVIWEDQYRVLDGKFIMKSGPECELLNTEPNVAHLEKFFNAKSIAVIGASESKGKVGTGVFDSLHNHEYRGSVFPVNPKHEQIMGETSYPSLSSIPGKIDLAVMATNIKHVPSVIGECKAKEINNLVIISGGGKELGGNSISLEKEIRKLGKAMDVRIIGPNCTGVFDGRSRVATFFQSQDRMLRPKDGPVAFMTQSGTVGVAFLEDAAAFGVRHYVSYGNRVDVDEADLLALWGNDPDIKVIGMYVEGFENGRKFYEVAKDVTTKKPVVIYKSARSEQGANASASHTGNLGGSYQIVDGALRQAGVITVNSYEELIAATKVLAMQPEANGDNVGMISNGAGSMIQGIDYLTDIGMVLPPLNSSTIKGLQENYPPYYITHNPIDVTGSGTSDDYILGIKAMLEDPNINLVLPWFVFVNIPLQEDIIAKLGKLNKDNQKPIIVGAFGGEYSKQMVRAIEQEGLPAFNSVRDWVCAANAISWRSRQ